MLKILLKQTKLRFHTLKYIIKLIITLIAIHESRDATPSPSGVSITTELSSSAD